MNVSGIIFSNIHDNNIPDLTRIRTMASVPFGCRYRLIDFALSNMVNSNISEIKVITHYNYHSLMDHIGSGKDWDLARRSGGIELLPPYVTAYANNINSLYKTRLDALKSVNYSISRIKSDYVVLSDCDVICNVDLNEMINAHIESGADITLAVKKTTLDRENANKNVLVKSDGSDRIVDISAYPVDYEGEADICLNIMVMKCKYLQDLILDSIAHGYTSMTRDIIASRMKTQRFNVFRYDCFFSCINSISDYFKSSMELISDPKMRQELFSVKNRPVYTKVRNSPPTYYSDDSVVKNSLVADGCTVYGTVENSILFRGVKIGKNTVVKNSILFQDTQTGENVQLNCVISDKNTVVRDWRCLSGHETHPFYIQKGAMI